VIRQRGGATRRRDDQQEETIPSAEEIGSQLRDARVERGLDLLTVHDRLSRPITLLEALEQGDLARLPDQTLALSTLRRYAAFSISDSPGRTRVNATGAVSTAGASPASRVSV